MIDRVIQILIFIGFAWAANSQTDQNLPGPILSFEESYHDFETIVQGEIVDYVFKFINKGDRPLVISNVLTSLLTMSSNSLTREIVLWLLAMC